MYSKFRSEDLIYMKNNKFLVVTWEMSREGGVEEVSRQVFNVLKSTAEISVNPFIVKKGRFGSLLSTLTLNYYLLVGWNIIVMHPFIFERNTFNWVLKYSKGLKIVWVHGIDVWGNFGKKNTLKLPLADKVIAVSKYTASQLKLNHPTSNVLVINNAIDTDLVQVSDTFNKESFELITVSRLSSEEQYKGHDLVLSAMNLLNQTGIFVKYNIVGKGDDNARLLKIVSDLNLKEQVVFHGYLNDKDLGLIYDRCSVFVMPSYVKKSEDSIWCGEGFGLVYLEAGLHKLPVIACNEGGQVDCIQNGETGFLVSPDAVEIAEKIKYLYENKKVAKKMGLHGERNVRDNFSMDVFGNSIKKVLRTFGVAIR